jgi:hypothetical protein
MTHVEAKYAPENQLQATSYKLQVERNGKVLDIIIHLIDQG